MKLSGFSRVWPRSRSDACRSMVRPADDWRIHLAILTLSCGLGLTYAFIVVGPRVLNPTDVSWLTDDSATEYLGWAFFRQEAYLTLPLGWSNAIGYPLGEQIAYMDSIPLLATIFWMIRGLLPESFQYLGINFVICCVLQFYFGYRISRRLCGGDRIAGVLGAMMFLTAPPFTWRASGHFALISHWVILAALDQFLQAAKRPSLSQIAWRAMMCFIAGGISPYITAMTVLVLSVTYLRTLLSQRSEVVRLAAGLAIALTAGTLGLMLFGFLRGADVSQYASGDYGKYTMNLLAPIDPQGYGALLLRQQPISIGQYEGYNYLGLGMLLTGVIAISGKPSLLRYLLSADAIPAIVIFIVSLLLALSTLGRAGPAILWQFDFPDPIMRALAAFRGSGRFFWPGYYLLFIGIIWSASHAFPDRRLPVLLAIAVIIQFLDLEPLHKFIRNQWELSRMPLVSSNPVWHDLGKTQRHLVVIPPWQCSSSPGGQYGYSMFGQLAQEQHMTVNSYYAGRYSNAEMAYFCTDQMFQVQEHGLQADSAYVFNRSMAASVSFSLGQSGKYCRYVDQLILCSGVPGKTGPDGELFRDVIRLRDGDVVPFATVGEVADRLVGSGWASAENWGRWMRGHVATMVFKIPPRPQRDIRLVLSINPYVPASHRVQRVDIEVNGTHWSEHTISEPVQPTLDIVIPPSLVADDGLIRLKFTLPDAVSPRSLGLSSDLRELSIGVTELRIEDAGG